MWKILFNSFISRQVQIWEALQWLSVEELLGIAFFCLVVFILTQGYKTKQSDDCEVALGS